MADHNFMKRMAPFLVLEILKAYTDEEHGLKVTRIVELLQQDYGITMERKAVSRILNDLLELSEIPQEYDWKNPMPFSIKFDVIPRSTGDIRENWRLCKEFEDAEICLLTDLLVSVPGYPANRLLEKLHRLGSPHLRSGGREIVDPSAVNWQMPVNMDYIERAIHNGRKVAFDYGVSRENKQTGLESDHVVSPYQMVFRNGNYYLICYDEGKGDIAYFRVEKIKNAVTLDEPAKDYHMVSSMARWNFSFRQYLDHYLPTNLEND